MAKIQASQEPFCFAKKPREKQGFATQNKEVLEQACYPGC